MRWGKLHTCYCVVLPQRTRSRNLAVERATGPRNFNQRAGIDRRKQELAVEMLLQSMDFTVSSSKEWDTQLNLLSNHGWYGTLKVLELKSVISETWKCSNFSSARFFLHWIPLKVLEVLWYEMYTFLAYTSMLVSAIVIMHHPFVCVSVCLSTIV